MLVSTNNVYGKISISNEAVAKIAGRAALDCYGIVELMSNGLGDTLTNIFNKDTTKGVKISTDGDKIYIDINVAIKFGVSISAVAESLKQAVKYHVEDFTGMLVDSVNVSILSVKL